MMTSQEELQRAVLDLLPEQGAWTEEEYLWLSDHSRQLLEFTDGYVEVLPMPTDEHQGISWFFCLIFTAYLQPLGGIVRYAPLRLRLRSGKMREPDLLVLRDAGDTRRQNRYWLGADLVLEIVSPDKPERDLVEKRREYAASGIPEYWIVNPLDGTITVLRLDGEQYVEHGRFRRGEQATSALLPGFVVDVGAAFDAR